MTIVWAAEISLSPYLLKLIIDGVIKTANHPDLMISIILVPVLLYASMSVFINLNFRMYDYTCLKFFPKLKSDVVEAMFSYLSKHSYTYFSDHFSGSLVKKIFDLSNGIEPVIQIPNTILIPRTIAVLIASAVLYTVHPLFCFILIAWTIGFVGTSFLMSKKSEKISYSLSESDNTMGGKLSDSITNIISAKLFSNFKHEKAVLVDAINVLMANARKLEWEMLKAHFVQGIWVTILISSMLTGLMYGRLHDWVTVGDFALILTLSVTISMNIYNVGQEMIRFSKEIGKCRQALNIIVEPHEIEDKPQAKKLNVIRGEILFDNVKFQYKGAEPLFQNKTVTIKPGQKVGLVGHSGSGKSTFVNLILRLFDLTQGRICIDDQDILTVTQDSLRQAIGMIPQEASLFHRTLMENIRYGRTDATDEEVIEAAKRAHAHEFISTLPEKYHSLVGERGVKLSGGQRQRIAIARAFLKNAPILMLDEATSQLDSVTEKYIQESLWELMQGKTTVVIAHRLSTLLHMDRILVFDQGKVVEDGTHQELLAKEGLYSELWKAQVGGFLLDDEKE